MHEIFKDRMSKSNISITELEAGIGCSKNYLSRFINGPHDLPAKWVPKIEEYLKVKENPGHRASVTDLPPELAQKVEYTPIVEGIYDQSKITGMEDELSFTKARILEPWIQQIRDYCLKNGLQPDEIPAKMDWMTSEIKRLTSLKEPNKTTKPGSAAQEERKILNPGADKTKQMIEVEPGTTAYFMRHGRWHAE